MIEITLIIPSKCLLKANDKSLSPINLPNNLTVNVEIKGMKYEIGGYTEKDLIATVNLDPVTNEGTYSLDINVESTHSSDQCTIVSVSPATIDVSFEKISSKTFVCSGRARCFRAQPRHCRPNS